MPWLRHYGIDNLIEKVGYPGTATLPALQSVLACSPPMRGATPSSSAATPSARSPAPSWLAPDRTPTVAPSRASPPARARSAAASGGRPPAPTAVLLVESALGAAVPATRLARRHADRLHRRRPRRRCPPAPAPRHAPPPTPRGQVLERTRPTFPHSLACRRPCYRHPPPLSPAVAE